MNRFLAITAGRANISTLGALGSGFRNDDGVIEVSFRLYFRLKHVFLYL